MRPFESLTAVMGAVVQRDAARLGALLQQVDASRFEATAIRHKCAGLIRAAIDDFRLKAPPALAGLRRYAAFAMTDNMALLEQAREASALLASVGIDHAVLKGAGRLLAGHRSAFCTHHFDLDILVRARDAQRAYDTLQKGGYRQSYGAAKEQWYRDNHHHLAPLEIPGGKPLELHVALASPGRVPFPTAWEDLVDVLEPDVENPHVFRFSTLGVALHLIAHGIDGTRLHDVALLAVLLRDDAELCARLRRRMGTAAYHIGIQAVLTSAVELCGARSHPTRLAVRYRAWLRRREELPSALRLRSQLIDAWYLNGGSLFGKATREALATTPARAIGRAATSLAAATVASFL